MTYIKKIEEFEFVQYVGDIITFCAEVNALSGAGYGPYQPMERADQSGTQLLYSTKAGTPPEYRAILPNGNDWYRKATVAELAAGLPPLIGVPDDDGAPSGYELLT